MTRNLRKINSEVIFIVEAVERISLDFTSRRENRIDFVMVEILSIIRYVLARGCESAKSTKSRCSDVSQRIDLISR